VALAGFLSRSSQRHALIERAIVPDNRRLANNDTHPVVNEEPAADLRTRMDLDAGEKAPDLGEQSGNEWNAVSVEKMRHAIVPQSVEPGIGENYLEDTPEASGCGIAFKNRLDVAKHTFWLLLPGVPGALAHRLQSD